MKQSRLGLLSIWPGVGLSGVHYNQWNQKLQIHGVEASLCVSLVSLKSSSLSCYHYLEHHVMDAWAGTCSCLGDPAPSFSLHGIFCFYASPGGMVTLFPFLPF